MVEVHVQNPGLEGQGRVGQVPACQVPVAEDAVLVVSVGGGDDGGVVDGLAVAGADEDEPVGAGADGGGVVVGAELVAVLAGYLERKENF